MLNARTSEAVGPFPNVDNHGWLRQFDPTTHNGYAWRVTALKRQQLNISADVSERPSLASASGLQSLGAKTFFRQRDAAEAGVHSRALRRLVDDGAVERVARGLYRRTDTEFTEHHTQAAVCARVPDAIICLLTALRVHDIGTQLPAKVWIAIPHKARTPVIGLPVRVVRFSGASLRYGIEDAEFEGVPVRITSPARTIVDCFRFRRIVGMDVALEAVREALADRRATPAQIRRAAETCRAESLVHPVLQALAA